MPTTDVPPLAELAGTTKRFGEVVALDGIDLALKPGQLTALLGPNGAGKTTVVKLLLGLIEPDAGAVRVFGGDPAAGGIRRRVGAMLQVSRVPETLRVGEHLDLFSAYYPAPLPAERVLAAAGLGALQHRRFSDLSGGERQRVLFALALCGDPDLLFLDEPTVGMDVEARRRFWGEIRRLVAEGRSLLLTTHYLEEADALADRVVVLNRGRIIADGTPAEIKQRTAGRRVRCRTVLGLEALRALPGVQAARSDQARVELLTSRAEEAVRVLLERDPGLTDLEVTGAGLEDAFLTLTGGRA
jgi:ABC-2 type transport system ATP-binding protein